MADNHQNSSPSLSLLNLLDGKTSDRMRKALTAYAIGVSAAAFARRVNVEIRGRFDYTITVPGDDHVFYPAVGAILKLLPEKSQRSLSVRTIGTPGLVDASGYGGPNSQQLGVGYDGDRYATIMIAGHRVDVRIERGTVQGVSEMAKAAQAQTQKLIFVARSSSGKEAVLQFLAELLKTNEERTPDFFTSRAWGGWSLKPFVPYRSIESVVLRKGQLESIVDDLTMFREREATYARLGLPYHRGYLFSGPPGTGKTSIAKALATHFGLDLYFASLADLGEDSSLLEMISDVRPNSVVLLEDIDTLAVTHERSEQGEEWKPKGGVSLSGLLNALDGVATPHGLIMMGTTNREQVLDAALVRPGRFDRVWDIGYVDDDQVRRLWEMCWGTQVDLEPLAGDVSAAEVIECFKHNFDDEAAALAELNAVLAATPQR